MPRPPLNLAVEDLGHRFIVDVDGPEALSQWCLELALLLCGHSPSFTAVSAGEWEGTVWFGLGAEEDDGVRIQREEGWLLFFMHRDLIDQLLKDAMVRYRTGRGWNETDWGPLTVKLTGPYWEDRSQKSAATSRRKR